MNANACELKLMRDDQSAFVSTTLALARFSLEPAADAAENGAGDSGGASGGAGRRLKLDVQALHSETRSGRWFSLAEAQVTSIFITSCTEFLPSFLLR